jgi:hypothetical protein
MPKQRFSMFRLNRNKQKTNRNSLIGSIFWYFFRKFMVFPVFSFFCLFRLFRLYTETESCDRFETPKQIETNQNFLFLVSRNKLKHNRNRSCFGLVFSVRTEIFFLLVSRTPNPRVLRGPGKFSARSTRVADPGKVVFAQCYWILPTQT